MTTSGNQCTAGLCHYLALPRRTQRFGGDGISSVMCGAGVGRDEGHGSGANAGEVGSCVWFHGKKNAPLFHDYAAQAVVPAGLGAKDLGNANRILDDNFSRFVTPGCTKSGDDYRLSKMGILLHCCGCVVIR